MEAGNIISLFNKPEYGGKIIKKISEDEKEIKIYNNRKYVRIKKKGV